MTLPEKIHRKELAELIGVTPRRIDQLAEDGHIPKLDGGMIDFKGAIQGLLNRKKENTTPAVERLNLAKAKREERKDKMEEGATIDAEEVFKTWENIVLAFRERILKIGNNVQSKCGISESQRKVVEQEASDALKELKKQITYNRIADKENETPNSNTGEN